MQGNSGRLVSQMTRIFPQRAIGTGIWRQSQPEDFTAHCSWAGDFFTASQALPRSASVIATLSRRYTGKASSGACAWPALNSRIASSATCAACG